VFKEMARVLGDDVARRLVERHAGEVRHIPKRPAPEHPLARTLGLDAARRLGRHFGGVSLYIPRGRPRLADCIAGLDGAAHEVAAALGCSTRHVRRVRARAGTEA